MPQVRELPTSSTRSTGIGLTRPLLSLATTLSSGISTFARAVDCWAVDGCAQQAEQVEVVRQVIVGADIDVQLCARTVGIALIEHFQQPLADPLAAPGTSGFR